MNTGLVLRKNDYDILMAYLRGQFGKKLFDQQNAEAMQSELNKAKLVSTEEFPGDAVGINTKVRIKDESSNKIMDLELVTPEKADIRKNKVSVLAPIGVALIGSRQGEKVSWNMPAGNKCFTIVEVINN